MEIGSVAPALPPCKFGDIFNNRVKQTGVFVLFAFYSEGFFRGNGGVFSPHETFSGDHAFLVADQLCAQPCVMG
jgi:hypothetical protein